MKLTDIKADEQKAFWDGLVGRFHADEQEARVLELTMSRTFWATTRQNLGSKMVIIRHYEEGAPVDPLDEFKEALPQLVPMDVPIPVCGWFPQSIRLSRQL